MQQLHVALHVAHQGTGLYGLPLSVPPLQNYASAFALRWGEMSLTLDMMYAAAVSSLPAPGGRLHWFSP